MSSSLSRPQTKTFSYGEFQALPKQGPDFLLDVAAIQARLNARAQQHMRSSETWFNLPDSASKETKRKMAHDAIGHWIRWMAQDHWALASDVRITGKTRPAMTPDNVILLGETAYQMLAVFRYAGPSPKFTRIELNPATVKQAPDHRLTLREAVKAWGLPVPKQRGDLLARRHGAVSHTA